MANTKRAHVAKKLADLQEHQPHYDISSLTITHKRADHIMYSALICRDHILHAHTTTAGKILEHYEKNRHTLCLKFLRYCIEREAVLHVLTQDLAQYGLHEHIVRTWTEGKTTHNNVYTMIASLGTAYPACKQAYDAIQRSLTGNDAISYDDILAYLEASCDRRTEIMHHFDVTVQALHNASGLLNAGTEQVQQKQ